MRRVKMLRATEKVVPGTSLSDEDAEILIGFASRPAKGLHGENLLRYNFGISH
jgi:hypothetical protein